MNLQLPFLNFPIFIGEVLLFICLVLFFLHVKTRHVQFERWHKIVIIFIIWLIVKAFHGYVTYGPLAFRHSALFYYSFFAIITFHLFDKKFFSQTTIILILVLMTGITKFVFIHTYFKLCYLMLFILLAMKLKHKYLKWGFGALFSVVYPFWLLFNMPKSHLLGVLIVCFFMSFYVCFFILRAYRILFKYVWPIVVSVCLVLGWVIVKYGGVGKLNPFIRTSNLFRISSLWEVYKEKEKDLEVLRKSFTFSPLEPRLYNPGEKESEEIKVQYFKTPLEGKLNFLFAEKNKDIFIDEKLKELLINHAQQLDKYDAAAGYRIIEVIKQSPGNADQYSSSSNMDKELRITDQDREEQDFQINAIIEEIVQDQDNQLMQSIKSLEEKSPNILSSPSNIKIIEQFRGNVKSELKNTYKMSSLVVDNYYNPKKVPPAQIEQNSFLFRYYIWKDMVEDMVNDHALLGVNMGKPQRSKNIEIMQWAMEEWSRDGWITAHNSFLYIIYRAGIVGVLIVCGIFWLFFRMVKRFIVANFIEGILLSSVILYWLILSFFNVFLEVPYYAIPFWSLFGIVARLSWDVESQKA